MKGTYDDLVGNLKNELDSGKVQIEQLQNGIRLSVADEILFQSGSAEIDAGGVELLTKVAAQVKDATHLVEVEGHTDDKPIRNRLAEKYPTNWELGAARASAVVRLLNEQGIDGTRLLASSRGRFEPVASNESDDGRAKNRRIEIRLLPLPATAVAEQTEAKADEVYATD
jgi:chemotaxis protein MotB